MAKKKKKKKSAVSASCAEAAVLPSLPDDEYSAAKAKADAELAGLDDIGRAEIIAAPNVPVPVDPSFSEEDFCRSVGDLTSDDIAHGSDGTEKKQKRKRKYRAGDIFQLGILAVCAAVAVFCIGLLVKSAIGKIEGSKVYSDAEFEHFTLDGDEGSFNHPSGLSMIQSDAKMLTLYERITEGKTPEVESGGEYAQKLAAMKASLSALKAQNKDVYGWIYVENTTIDHPIMRGEDNKYYLDHAYNGDALPIGSIFFDCDTADRLEDNYNAVIYGHNVFAVAGSKSSMFHDLTKFMQEDFFNANKIYIYTMDGVYIYKAVSIYSTDADYYYFRNSFPDEASFLTFANQMVKNSKVPCDETFSKGDKMLTFSTCTNGESSGRYAMHAKLVEIIK